MSPDLCRRCAAALSVPEIAVVAMLAGGGHVRTWLVTTPAGTRLAIKEGRGHRADHLGVEAAMLRLLQRALGVPTPEILHSEDDLLILNFIDHDGGSANGRAEWHLAELVAALHGHKAAGGQFGHTEHNLIGLLNQPNAQNDSWVDFFRDQRLLAMTTAAHREGVLPDRMYRQLQQLSMKLDGCLLEPEYPALLHGDLWSGNILTQHDEVVGLIDPAPYYGHPEIELAYGAMFGPCGQQFHDAYNAIRPIEPDFIECRRDIYNLYPLLVHVRLFGHSYLAPIHDTLKRLGF